MEHVIDLFATAVNTHCMENRSDPRLSPDAWVDAAYAAFETGGVAAVRVDPLAKALGITRGSFYWHFKDRGALLRAVIERWQTVSTEQEIEAIEAAGGSPAERLLRLLRSCATDDGKFEIGIRAWASEDRAVGAIVAKTDARRIAYLTELATEAGVPTEIAEARARVAYLAWLGSYMGAVPSGVAQRSADMDCLWAMLLDGVASP